MNLYVNVLNEEEAEVSVTCPSCKKKSVVVVPISGIVARNNGAYIQDAFPTLSPAQRELFLSGLCDDCFPS